VKTLLRTLHVCLLCSAASSTTPAVAAPPAGFAVATDRELGTPTSVRATEARSPAAARASVRAADAEPTARAFLRSFAHAYRLDDPSRELLVRHVRRDAGRFASAGMTHVRMSQTYRGLPVFASSLAVHLGPDLAVAGATGRTAPTPTVDTRPRLSDVRAVELATAHVSPQLEEWRRDPALPRRVELGVYVPQLFGDSGPTRLAYRVLQSGFEVYVDAGSGEIVKAFGAVPTARDRQTYDDTVSTTTPVLVESDPPFPGQDYTSACPAGVAPVACATHLHVAEIYDNLWTRFGRDGWDDLGSPLIVHTQNTPCCGAAGCAFGNSICLAPQSPDSLAFTKLVGHEYGHNIDAAEIQWPYTGETGGLEEGFADIWAMTFFPGLFEYATYDRQPPYDAWYPPGSPGPSDLHAGGLIPGWSARALMGGGDLRSIRVEPIGVEKFQRIFYYAVTQDYVISTSGMAATAAGLVQACLDLSAGGVDGITAADCGQVANAFTATGMLGTLHITAPVDHGVTFYAGRTFAPQLSTGVIDDADLPAAMFPSDTFRVLATNRATNDAPAVVWHSDEDGTYAPGAIVLGRPLGWRRVYATATFSSGYSATASVDVKVVDPILSARRVASSGAEPVDLPLACSGSTPDCRVAVPRGTAITFRAAEIPDTPYVFDWTFTRDGGSATFLGRGALLDWNPCPDPSTPCAAPAGTLRLRVWSGWRVIASQTLRIDPSTLAGASMALGAGAADPGVEAGMDPGTGGCSQGAGATLLSLLSVPVLLALRRRRRGPGLPALSLAVLLLAPLVACKASRPPEAAAGGGSAPSSVAYCTPNYAVAPLPNTQSGNFNRTSQVCFVVENTGPLVFNCSNMAGRTVTVNGTAHAASTCDSSSGKSVAVPYANDGKYYFDVSAGGLSYASIAFWAGSEPGGPGSGGEPTTLFIGCTAAAGCELWTTDGTVAGTALVKDLRPGPQGSDISGFTSYGGAMYFSAQDGTHGYQLWKTDGTAAGTQMVKVFDTLRFRHADKLAVYRGALYFEPGDSNGLQLWKTDGTEAGTALVSDLPAPEEGFTQAMAVYRGDLYLAKAVEGSGCELWRTDGTADNTLLVKDITLGARKGSRPGAFTVFGGKLYFRTVDGDQRGIWVTDGTTAGTVQLLSGDVGLATDPDPFVTVRSGLYVVADQRLWRLDATGGPVAIAGDPTSSPVSEAEPLGDTLVFAMSDAAHGRELYRTDGTAAGVQLLTDLEPGSTGSDPQGLTPFGGYLYFAAGATVPSGAGTEYRSGLWRTDGTAAGTTFVASVYLSAMGPVELKVVNGRLLFGGADDTHSRELWVSDGTPGGTHMLLELYPTPAGGIPTDGVGFISFTDGDR
jgi:ELWxxDGT repeat protein